jgi:ABC-type lipoprotein export system ATPase subunit
VVVTHNAHVASHADRQLALRSHSLLPVDIVPSLRDRARTRGDGETREERAT